MTTICVTHPRYIEHDLPGHPEHAGRIRAVWRALDESGLAQRMNTAEASMVDLDAILAVHTPAYLDLLQRVSAQERTVHLDGDTYAGPDSFEIARLSAGGVVDTVAAVLSGKADNGLAAVRPPGHHAMPDHGMGFCLLGNVGIAARYAQKQFDVERILIVDYDVHHGNGTEAMFYDDPSVLFISTHQYPLYPGSGALRDTGSGTGQGYTINIPMPAGCGDQNYAAVFDQIIWKAAERFQPQFVIVSAGFDAHWADPLAGMRLSLNGYAHLSSECLRMARQFCGGKIVFVMEGGYNLDALGGGVSNSARILLGDAPVDPLGPNKRAEPDITALLGALKQLHMLS
ncbi:MAG TPA: histone deacetylase [Phototrophicaceae bacterium]|nr:histone deacetylase [Phototrophicaceae bacterium]